MIKIPKKDFTHKKLEEILGSCEIVGDEVKVPVQKYEITCENCGENSDIEEFRIPDRSGIAYICPYCDSEIPWDRVETCETYKIKEEGNYIILYQEEKF